MRGAEKADERRVIGVQQRDPVSCGCFIRRAQEPLDDSEVQCLEQE